MGKKYVGVGGFTLHDAGVTCIDDKGNIEFASLSERYTKKKHDWLIPAQQWIDTCGTEIIADLDPNIWVVLNDDWEKREEFRRGFVKEHHKWTGASPQSDHALEFSPKHNQRSFQRTPYVPRLWCLYDQTRALQKKRLRHRGYRWRRGISFCCDIQLRPQTCLGNDISEINRISLRILHDRKFPT